MQSERSSRTISIGDRSVGDGAPCFVIGEVAQGHDGSLGLALSFIDAIANAGADAVKFQTHIAEAESTPGEPWRVQFSLQDATRSDYWKRTGFSAEQWCILAERARARGLAFLSSAFSPEAVDLLDEIDVAAWKVASGEVLDLPVLERMARSGRPAIVSTGMSAWAEIDETVELLERLGIDFALLQCTTRYPTSAEDVGLNVMGEMRSRYGVPVGLSDHTGRPTSALVAVALGAEVLEVHATFSKQMFGPDTSSSLTMEELSRLVDDIRYTESMLRSPVDKDAMASSLADLHDLFTKSLVAAADLEAGTTLDRAMVRAKKPGTGIPAVELDRYVGRTLRRAVATDEPFRVEDFEGEPT